MTAPICASVGVSSGAQAITPDVYLCSNASAQLPRRVPGPEEVVGRRPGRAGSASQELNVHRGRGTRRGPAP